MQVTIYQAEIEEAIRTHIHNIISVKDGHEIKIDLKATRGDTGFQAIIDIEPINGSKPASRPAQRVVTPASKPAPVITTADLKRMHEEEAAAEAAAEAEAEGAVSEGTVEGTVAGEEAVAIPDSEEAPAVVEEAQTPAPKPVAAPAPAATRPVTQVAGAAPGPAGAPPKRLFAGFSRPNNTGA